MRVLLRLIGISCVGVAFFVDLPGIPAIILGLAGVVLFYVAGPT